MEERLISRFKWGLSADLQMPDFETRVAILDAKAQQMGVEIPYPVLEYLAFNVKNNIRELEGVVKSLIFSASIHKRHIDKELAKEVISNHVSTVHKYYWCIWIYLSN